MMRRVKSKSRQSANKLRTSASNRTKIAPLSGEEVERYCALLQTERLDDILERAQRGDTLAAMEGLESITWVLANGEIPAYARQYLARAFHKIITGTDANKALNLRRSARPREWPLLQKRLAADIVAQLVSIGHPVLKAIEDAVDLIERHAVSAAPVSPWHLFKTKRFDSSTLRKWYYAHKNALAAMREAAKESGK